MARITKQLWLIFGILSISTARKNVLFLVVDDLRPEIKAYNNTGAAFYPNMHTPNLDALAAKSLVLKSAYVQQAICAPSRTSLLTGRRPDTTHVYDIHTYWRDVGGDFMTLPQYFKEHGYETGGIGKILHPGKASGNNDPVSWTLKYFRGRKTFENRKKSWRAINDDKLITKPLIDKQVADKAIETLRDVSAAALSGDKPFFLAVGFYKPHLPFVFPKSMLQFYPKDSIELPENPYVPENMPRMAWQGFIELRKYRDMSSFSGHFNETLPDATVKALRRAYYASITWVDQQIGRVLQELESLGLSDNTIVSFWGDHGWQLGEHAQWCKFTNFELATRAPMMLHIPGKTDSGINTEQLTEFVDLFPSLVDAVGLPSIELCGDKSVDTVVCTEGTSLLPLINAPNTPIKKAAFSQYMRKRKNGTYMGYSIRTDQYRYTEWVLFDTVTYEPDWNTPRMKRELYDNRADTEENFNIVDSLPDIAASLSSQLHNGWRSAMISSK